MKKTYTIPQGIEIHIANNGNESRCVLDSTTTTKKHVFSTCRKKWSELMGLVGISPDTFNRITKENLIFSTEQYGFIIVPKYYVTIS